VPLAFPALSPARVVFGFFNVETDLLLLERSCFFARDFCGAIAALGAGDSEATVTARRVDGAARLGDLHGAMTGRDLGGLIGATYRRWPFPATADGFRQSPEGEANRAEVEALIEPFGRRIELVVARRAGVTKVGDVVLDLDQLGGLVAYVDRGGLPRWRDERRPEYVLEMARALLAVGSCWSGAVRPVRESARPPRES
jgi:hypothetical protein